jgi:hypothetical protein
MSVADSASSMPVNGAAGVIFMIAAFSAAYD